MASSYIRPGLADFATVTGRKAPSRRVSHVLGRMKKSPAPFPAPDIFRAPMPRGAGVPSSGFGVGFRGPGGPNTATIGPRGFGPMHNPAPVSPLQGHFEGGGDNPKWVDPYDTDPVGDYGPSGPLPMPYPAKPAGFQSMPRPDVDRRGFFGNPDPEFIERILRMLQAQMGSGGVPGAY